ncbi:MAG: lipoprotein, partial [Bacilli bacterium]|nr:lipoprotein [Bacilli bacterium]
MKKILIIITFIFLLTGCTNIEKTSVEDLINQVKTSKIKLNNIYRTGYKYYLPNNLQVKNVEDFNE